MTKKKTKDIYLTKTDLKKLLGVTPPEETLTFIDRKTGIRIIIEPYIKSKGVGISVNKKINFKQLIKVLNPKRSILKTFRRRGQKWKQKQKE